jgi:hypothetical protein
LKVFLPNGLSHKSLYPGCHSGLDPESSLSNLDSRFRGNDGSPIIVNSLWKDRTHILWKASCDKLGILVNYSKAEVEFRRVVMG